MATSVQIVFDCADPDRLGAFWAAALHYRQQEPPPGFASWEAFLKDRGVPEEEWNSANAIIDPEKAGPRIYFQKMDTPKPRKNRVHLDLNVSGGGRVPLDERVKRITAEVERILRLGATKQKVWEEPDGGYFVVMLDPEGNEFCIQ
jgi:hypothetical protein